MSQQAAIPDLMTVDEVAERLRCHPDTVRRLIDRGELAAAKVGGRLLIATSEVRRIVLGAVCDMRVPAPRTVESDCSRPYRPRSAR